MKFNCKYIGLLSGALLLNACIKDKGNYDLITGNKVDVKYANSQVIIYVGDTLRLDPVRTFSNPADTTDFDHKWYANGKFYSDKPRLELIATETAGYTFAYYITDRKSGITYAPTNYLNVAISSRYITGWGILYQDSNGNSEIAHVNENTSNNTFTDYTGLYQKANGAPAGKLPVKISHYLMRGTPCLFLIQQGAPGSLDMSGTDMKKKLVVSQSFTQGTPADFEAVDMASFATADLVVSKNGDLFGRFFNGAAVFTIPWMSTPINVAKGCKITDIWDSWYKQGYTALMYDRLNKRVLQSNLAGFTPGGGVNIDSMPQPITPYPADYTSLHNFGDWEYIWGGTFHEAYNGILNGALLIRNPADHQVYYEDFIYKNGMGQPNVLTPGKRILFPGSAQVNSKTKYAALKLRDYIFFSGGTDNKQLYYFDAIAGGLKTYVTLTSPITSVAVNDNSLQVAIGLEDGTFILYDVSNDVMLSGKPKELHRLSGLGKVADVIFKSYNY